MSFAKITLAVLFSICAALLSLDSSLAQQQPLTRSAESSLGKVDFAISCSSAAQSQFNRGLALLHHMMYAQAEKEFKKVAELDPDCTMAHWGIAMTLFHPLWAEPNEEELRRGWVAVEKAKALKPHTKREQGYVAAVDAFYKNRKTVDHPTRIAAWEAAQERVQKAYPSDIDAGAFYALAHLATAPKGDKTFTHQKEAGSIPMVEVSNLILPSDSKIKMPNGRTMYSGPKGIQ